MSKQSVPFACVMFMMALVMAVSAQEIPAIINDTALNGAALLNNTTLNATSNVTAIAPLVEAIPGGNETLTSAANETHPVANEVVANLNESLSAENETVPAENITEPKSAAPAASLGGSSSLIALDGANQIASPKKPVVAVGGAASTPNLFSIGMKYLPDEAYNVGLPAETIMDLSSMPFYLNEI